uniref:Uncharacterized protein n=1 Tax=Anguilla anguilla TaxID=7936 RepID=A0A0E9SKU6_ANGAN
MANRRIRFYETSSQHSQSGIRGYTFWVLKDINRIRLLLKT